VRAGRIEFAPLKVGTQRILRSTDPALAAAFNQSVEAIRELQQAVAELQTQVAELARAAASAEDSSANREKVPS
jgi:hypothetical protein